MLNIYCDGSITGSHWAPKGQKDTLPRIWAGWLAIRDGALVHHHSWDIGESKKFSANVAEYCAIRSALFWAKNHYPLDALRIHSDSQVVLCQLTGAYACGASLLHYRDACRKLASHFPSVTYKWISRDKNTAADALSRCLQPKFGGRLLTAEEVEPLCQQDGSL